MRTKGLRATAAAALLAAALPFSAQAETLSPGQMRTLGFEFDSAGRPQLALEVAEALLQRDPQDTAALILKSRALRSMGREGEAADLAATAWANGADPAERFGAAMARAQALSSQGKRSSAQFWLRRAAQVAPSEAARATAVRDFRYVRERNPVRVNLSFGIAPSSNVNGGSQHATSERYVNLDGTSDVGVFSPTARALSGVTARAAITARFRLQESQSSSTWLRLGASHREVRLSAQSRRDLADWAAMLAAQDPFSTPPRDNYDFSSLEIGLNQTRSLGAVTMHYGVTSGRTRYGGAALSNFQRLELGGETLLAANRILFASLGLERSQRHDSARRDSRQLSLGTGVVQQLASGDRLKLGLSARNTQSQSEDIRHRAAGLQLSWVRAEPLIAGVRLEAEVGLEARRYDPSRIAAGGRQDLRLDAQVSLVLDRFDYMGFAPVVDFQASRFRSNVRLYDGRDAGISVGFRSRF